MIEAIVVKIVAKKDGFDRYLRFDGDQNVPLHLKTEEKMRKTIFVMSENAVSPTKIDRTPRLRYQGLICNRNTRIGE